MRELMKSKGPVDKNLLCKVGEPGMAQLSSKVLRRPHLALGSRPARGGAANH